MDEAIIFDTLREAIWVSVRVSGPILAVALAVGLAIGLFQALTSVQEMTLTFVPKVVAMLITMWLTLGFMSAVLRDFFTARVIPLIGGM